MTREETKTEIKKIFDPAFANYIIKTLTNGATESDVKPQEWISVKDRLPESSGEYYITVQKDNGERYTTTDRFYGNTQYFKREEYYKCLDSKIVAWQEKYVPSPYKGE